MEHKYSYAMKTLILILFAAISVSLSAQEYKEGLFYDLTGPVKEVQVNTESDFAVKKVVFLEDGRCTLSIMTFKEDGMPFGWSVNNDGSIFSCSIDYDDQNRISSTTTIDTMADPYQETRFYTYSEDGTNNIISDMTVLFTTANTNTATNFEYSDYKFDKYGNWISREVNQTVYPMDAPTDFKTSNYVETREITYY